MDRTLSIISVFLFLAITISCSKNKKAAPAKKPETIEVKSFPDWITADYVMGHFDPATHPDFVIVPTEYADRAGLYLHKDTWEAYAQMYEAAKKVGHKLVIRSATRNFNYQKGIWERKWTGTTKLSDGTKASDISDAVARAKKILLYSSMPGTSRHHWGTDFDINSFENSYFTSGKGGDLYKWLSANAANYGFCQPYTNKLYGRTGYEEERWHWTYSPLSKTFTEYCKTHIEDNMITGFQGSETAKEVGMLQNYILGINTACL